MQEDIKAMTKILDGLSVIGDPISEEDCVVHLLASLPDSNNMLVTALEANVEVSKKSKWSLSGCCMKNGS